VISVCVCVFVCSGSGDGLEVELQQRSGRSYDSRSATAPVGFYPPSYTTELYQTNHQSVRQPLTSTMPPNSKPSSLVSASLPLSSVPPSQASAESILTSRTEHYSQSRSAHAQSELSTPHTSTSSSRPADGCVSNNEAPPTETPKDAWYTFSEELPINKNASTNPANSEIQIHRSAETRPNYENVFPLKRYGSVGAFSDDFVLDNEKQSHRPSMPSRLGQSGRVAGSIPHLPSATLGARERSAKVLNRSAEILSPVPASHEGERELLNEFRYRRLLPSPSGAVSSQEISPSLRRRGGDLEHLIQPGSPDTECTGSTLDSSGKTETPPLSHRPPPSEEVQATGGSSEGQKDNQAIASPPEPYQTPVAVKPDSTTGGGASGTAAPSEIPACESVSTIRPPSTDQTSSDSDQAAEGSEAQNSVFTPEPPHTDQGGEVSDREFWTGILAASSDTGKSGGEEDGRGGASSLDRNRVQNSASNAPVPSEDCEAEVLLSISPAPPELLNVFPQALDSDSNLSSGEASLLTTLDTSISGPQANSASTPPPPNSATDTPTVTATAVAVQSSIVSDGDGGVTAMHYGPMSPIPEASQEMCGSMSQRSHLPRASQPHLEDKVNSTNKTTGTPPDALVSSAEPIRQESNESSTQAQPTNIQSAAVASQSHRIEPLTSPRRATSPRPSQSSELTRFSRSPSPVQLTSGLVNKTIGLHTSPRRQRQNSPVTSPTRSMSPLATSSISAKGQSTLDLETAPYQATRGGTSVMASEQVSGDVRGATEPPEPTARRADSPQEQQERKRGSSENEQQSPSRRDSTGSKMRYSHQRQDSSRSQNRIRQELDAMNTAITAMDSQVSQTLYTQGSSGTGNILGWAGSQRGMAGSRHCQMHSPDPSQSTQQSLHQDPPRSSHSHARKKPQQEVRNSHTHVNQQGRHASGSGSTTPKASSARGHSVSAGRAPSIPSHNNFRPITPAMATATGGSRPSSAPGTGEDGGRGLDHRSSTPHPLTGAPMNREVGQEGRRHQTRLQQHSTAQSLPHHLRDTRPANPNADGHQMESTRIQPPQVTPDSYDYLPPYSPPRASLGGKPPPQQSAPQSSATPSTGEGEAYSEPPPSYDEIFGEHEAHVSSLPSRGQRDRNRHGGRGTRTGNSRQRRRRDRLQTTSSDNHSSSQTRQSALGRLSSITSIFRRSHSRPAQSEMDHPDIGIEDYTADWVASYSHTPRPYSSQAATPYSAATSHHQVQHLDQHADRSQLVDGHAHNNGATTPVPYVHPPPFPASEQSQQRQLPRNPLLAGQGSNMNRSLSRLPTTSTHTSSPRLRNTSGRDRSRPSSAYFLSDARIFHLPSSPGLGTPQAQPTSARPHSHCRQCRQLRRQLHHECILH